MSETKIRQVGDAILNGDSLLAAMRDVSLRHAARLRELGPVMVLALDPCPLCGGTVLASDQKARCACGWGQQ